MTMLVSPRMSSFIYFFVVCFYPFISTQVNGRDSMIFIAYLFQVDVLICINYLAISIIERNFPYQLLYTLNLRDVHMITRNRGNGDQIITNIACTYLERHFCMFIQ
jgi:hypothetical protein